MVSETIIHFPGYNLFFHEFHEMAVAYENEDFVLSAAFSWRYHNFLKLRKLGLPTY